MERFTESHRRGSKVGTCVTSEGRGNRNCWIAGGGPHGRKKELWGLTCVLLSTSRLRDLSQLRISLSVFSHLYSGSNSYLSEFLILVEIISSCIVGPLQMGLFLLNSKTSWSPLTPPFLSLPSAHSVHSPLETHPESSLSARPPRLRRLRHPALCSGSSGSNPTAPGLAPTAHLRQQPE